MNGKVQGVGRQNANQICLAENEAETQAQAIVDQFRTEHPHIKK